MKCPCCSAALGNYNNPKPISLWHKPVGGAVTGVGAGAGAGNWEQGEQGGRSDQRSQMAVTTPSLLLFADAAFGHPKFLTSCHLLWPIIDHHRDRRFHHQQCQTSRPGNYTPPHRVNYSCSIVSHCLPWTAAGW